MRYKAKWWSVALATVVVLAVALFALSRPLGFDDPATSAPVITAGSPEVEGGRIRPYRATYRRRTTVLGIPIQTQEVVVTAALVGDSLVGTFEFEGGVTDRIVLDPKTLRPLRRGFTGQAFVFDGQRVTAWVDRPEGAVDTLDFRFAGAPFEVSLLDWVVVAMDGHPPSGFRLAWDNFNDQDGWLVPARRTVAPDGAEAAGVAIREVVDLRFSDGRIRRFWLTDEPPYKLRQKGFENGRLVVSTWELLDYSADGPP